MLDAPKTCICSIVFCQFTNTFFSDRNHLKSLPFENRNSINLFIFEFKPITVGGLCDHYYPTELISISYVFINNRIYRYTDLKIFKEYTHSILWILLSDKCQRSSWPEMIYLGHKFPKYKTCCVNFFKL